MARKNANSMAPFIVFGIKIPLWALKCYEAVGVFCFGAACSQLITDVGKYTIGRLRPHFMDVCDPITDCDKTSMQHQYITNYTCRGQSSKRLREAR